MTEKATSTTVHLRSELGASRGGAALQLLMRDSLGRVLSVPQAYDLWLSLRVDLRRTGGGRTVQEMEAGTTPRAAGAMAVSDVCSSLAAVLIDWEWPTFMTSHADTERFFARLNKAMDAMGFEPATLERRLLSVVQGATAPVLLADFVRHTGLHDEQCLVLLAELAGRGLIRICPGNPPGFLPA